MNTKQPSLFGRTLRRTRIKNLMEKIRFVQVHGDVESLDVPPLPLRYEDACRGAKQCTLG